MRNVRVQFEKEAMRVISDEEYRQPTKTVELLAALTCFIVMGLMALVFWAHELARIVR